MKIIAHRANDGIHEENSLEAILNSLEKEYIDGIEIDIRLTKDNKLIICHDPFYRGHFIKYTKIKKLEKLGLNSLNEILIKLKTNKIVMLEIKTDDKNHQKLANILNKTLKKYSLNFYLCSFNYDLMKLIKEKYYQYKCGLIIGYQINKDKINNNLNFNSLSLTYANKNFNKETFIWTINDIKRLKINKRYNIITDNPLKIFNELSK